MKKLLEPEIYFHYGKINIQQYLQTIFDFFLYCWYGN